MEFRGKIKDCVRTFKGGYIFTITTEQGLSESEINNLADIDLKVEIRKYREKRSKNANDYSWVLQDKISKAVGKSIDEVHEQMVLDYGVVETYSIRKDVLQSAIRLFDYYKILGESKVNNTEFVHIRAGIGTHLYDTKEMSVFIDGVVQEAQQLNIETKTPKEIAEMLNLWEQGER